jgi:hypothetical protein
MARGEVTGKKPVQTPDAAKRKHGPPSADPEAVEPISHGEPTSTGPTPTPPIRGPPLATADSPKYRRKPKSVDPHALAMSIHAFCVRHDISEDLFFKMQREGWGPAVMRVGARTLISVESAADWRRERERDAQTDSTEAAA